jgi:hypothetical protein
MSETAGSELGEISVDVASCHGVRRTETGKPDERTVTVLEIGPDCSIPMTSKGAALVGQRGTTCTLHVGNHDHRLRITDALATYTVRDGLVPSRAFVGKFQVTRYFVHSEIDSRLVGLRIGADEDDDRGTTRHVLLTFEGQRRREAQVDAWCHAILPSYGSPDAPQPELPGEGSLGRGNPSRSAIPQVDPPTTLWPEEGAE